MEGETECCSKMGLFFPLAIGHEILVKVAVFLFISLFARVSTIFIRSQLRFFSIRLAEDCHS